MESFDKIRQDYIDYANKSLSLEGVAVNKLCTLLAYSTYKNQILQLGETLERNFSSCTKLNSRIFHAANLNYSVFRGRCPLMLVNYVRAAENKSVKYLDQALFYNGYYFYYTQDYDFTLTNFFSLSLLCSTKVIGSVDIDVTDDLYSVELTNIENVSSDYQIIEQGATTKIVDKSRITEDSSVFYQKEKNDLDEYEYMYDYLVTTIPGYGVKITRRAGTEHWGDNSTRLTFRYIPYSETVPDVTNLTSIPGFVYVSEMDTDKNVNIQTELIIVPFTARQESITDIYNKSISSVYEQNSVVTEEDLLIFLNKQPGLENSNFEIYTDTEIEANESDPSLPPTVSDNALISTIVYYNVDSETILDDAMDAFLQTFSVPRQIERFKAQPVNFTGLDINDIVYVKAFPPSKELTNAQLANLCNSYHSLIGQELTHAKFEADIVKLGFEYVKVYTDPEGTTELTTDVQTQIYQYPNISALVI